MRIETEELKRGKATLDMVNCDQQQLHISNLRFEAIVGILKEERESPQPLIVNANMDVDFNKAHHVAHKMDGGLDYSKMVEFLTTRIKAGEFGLLEDLLDTVGRQAFVTFRDLKVLELRVDKPTIMETCQSVGASILLRRET